jgi:hypothetical protein
MKKTLKEYTQEISLYFFFLEKDFNMQKHFKGDNMVFFENANCIVEMSLDRYSDNLLLIFYPVASRRIINSVDISRQKDLLGKKIFAEEIYHTANEIQDEVLKQVFFKAQFLKEYCSEFLKGDFSSLR